MSAVASRSSSPTLDTLAELNSANFAEKINDLWSSASRIKDAVVAEVEQENMPPALGFGIVSCITGQTFGYQLFHSQPNGVDMLGSLYADVTSRRQ